MPKKAILLDLALILSLLLTFWALFTTPVVADPTIIKVPEDYERIRWAVGNASAGDIIQVASGTYYEHLTVDKSVKLIGEDPNTTIIDGNGTWIVVHVSADNVEISGFTIRNGMGKEAYCPGIQVSGSRCIVNRNIISNNFFGIWLDSSSGNIVSNNIVTDNQYGIAVSSSAANVIRDNTITSNWLYGIELFASDNNTIVANKISYNRMTATTCGIYIDPYSSGNTFYHNNFINNMIQARDNGANTWDKGYPFGGNYWSDYAGVDNYSGPYQNETYSDGIGDTPYMIEPKGRDNYPLMYPYPVILVDQAYVSDDRVDVGSIQTVGFHAKWAYDNSDLVGGGIYVNGTKYVTNQTGWISFNAVYNTVGKRSWAVTGVSLNAITHNYKQVVCAPSIIWDRIQFTLNIADDRIDVDSNASIIWSGTYEYDGSPFTGSVSFNDTTIKDSVGKYGYTIRSVLDPEYGLTNFTSNSIHCIFDRIKILDGGVTSTLTNITHTETVWFKAIYEYDLATFDGSKGILYVNGSAMMWSAGNNRWEYNCTFNTVGKRTFKVSGVSDAQYGLTVINDVVGGKSITWRDFQIVYDGVIYVIPINTNSTMSDLTFNQTLKQISFTVTGTPGTSGFCNVTILIELLDGNFTVLIDDTPIDYTLTQNATHSFLYFTYSHGDHNVKIKGTTVIPEFPLAVVLPLFMIVAIVTVVPSILLSRRRNLGS